MDRLDHGRAKWQAFVNVLITFDVPQISGYFSICCGPRCFLRKILTETQ